MRHPDGLYYYQLENHQVSSKIPIIKHRGKEILPTDPEFADKWAAEPLRQLREQRNQLLQQSDWMAVSDRTMSPEQIAYRQSLRDMPANNPDVALNEAGELINITWPTEPQ